MAIAAAMMITAIMPMPPLRHAAIGIFCGTLRFSSVPVWLPLSDGLLLGSSLNDRSPLVVAVVATMTNGFLGREPESPLSRQKIQKGDFGVFALPAL